MNRTEGHVVLLTGASGQLGRWTLRELARRNCRKVHAWSGRKAGSFEGFVLEPVVLEDRPAVQCRLDEIRPDIVIHTAAMSAADEVRQHPEQGRLINEEATRTLAQWCESHGSRMVYTSTDLVFDGSKAFWTEDDAPGPLLEYGRTKARSEGFVTATKLGLVARIALLFGPTLTGKPSFWSGCMDAFRKGESRTIFTDEFRTPLDYVSAAEMLCELAMEHPDKTGVIHLGGPERMSRFELIRRSAIASGFDASLIRPALSAETPMPEPRPRDVSLSSEKLDIWLPDRVRRSPERIAQGRTSSES
ncbi:sugar nucleotide-binding protein [bacterium]|nr:sugar nucleotide-binding protein [bacterium]